MKNYEVYCRKFSQVCQSPTMYDAMLKFQAENKGEEVIIIEEIAARNEALTNSLKHTEQSPSTETGQQGVGKDLKYWKERWSYIQKHNPGRSGNHIEDLINEFLASQPQEVGQDESVKCIISDNLYNIRGSNQQGLFDTDKCDEIASFILQDILKEFTIIKK